MGKQTSANEGVYIAPKLDRLQGHSDVIDPTTGVINDGFGDSQRYDPPTREVVQLPDGMTAYLGRTANN